MSRLVHRTQFLVAITVLVLAASIASAQQRMCVVPDAKMEDAKATFAKIAAVLRHPRCINCHGAQSPFTPNTQHEGGAYDVIKDPSGFVLEDKTSAACETCHGDLKGWRMAPDDMSFVDHEDVDLCILLKMKLHTGPNVIQHFTNDLGGTPFIEVAFQGTRGLNEQGRALVDNYHPEPIEGISQSQLISLAHRWLSDIDSEQGLIGGDRNTECGCVPHHYALEFHDHESLDIQGVHWEMGLTSDPLVRLIFDDSGTFHSETTTASRPGAGTTGPCKIQSGGSVTVSAKGRLADTTSVDRYRNPLAMMKVAITEQTVGVSAGVECPKGALSTNLPGGSGSLDFELQAVVGAKSPEIPTVPGVRGTIWVKIIQID
jgi:hypothetical protein